ERKAQRLILIDLVVKLRRQVVRIQRMLALNSCTAAGVGNRHEVDVVLGNRREPRRLDRVVRERQPRCRVCYRMAENAVTLRLRGRADNSVRVRRFLAPAFIVYKEEGALGPLVYMRDRDWAAKVSPELFPLEGSNRESSKIVQEAPRRQERRSIKDAPVAMVAVGSTLLDDIDDGACVSSKLGVVIRCQEPEFLDRIGPRLDSDDTSGSHLVEV